MLPEDPRPKARDAGPMTSGRGVRKLLRLAALCLVVGAVLPAAGQSTPPQLGPAPRDSDGRFDNFHGPLPQAGLSVTLPFFARRIVTSFQTPGGKARLE